VRLLTRDSELISHLAPLTPAYPGNTMERKDVADAEGESSDAAVSKGVNAAHAQTPAANFPVFPVGHSSFVDPNVMMMTNAAATIAAVASSAVQQIAQAKGSQPTSMTPGTTSPVPPGLVAALRNVGPGIVPSNAQTLNPQIAAILGAAAGSPTIPFQNPAMAVSTLAALAGKINPPEAKAKLPPSKPAPASSVSTPVLPSMQSWSVEQIGTHKEYDPRRVIIISNPFSLEY